ncbi:MAG: cbb3-type cytochrome c oxidase subunit I [Planctomycetota bacterium]|jgi:cytochrome c oxidase subunit 1|nr:cbb3-type cytochrome c oxidase subunit I [Planctomycetota bacterium]
MLDVKTGSGAVGASVGHDSKVNYLNHVNTAASWFLTLDHKRIALLYLVVTSFMFVLGGAYAGVIRAELITPKGDFVSSDFYNKSFTAHGVIMVFFVLIPAIPSVIGNFCLPLMLGAKDVAFPRINLISWYVYMAGAAFTLFALISGGVDSGWTFYTPLSTTYLNSNVMATATGLFILGFASILTGLNFIVTIHRMRSPGLTWFRLPLFVWAIYATSVIQLLGTPVIAITLALVGVERALGVGIFDPRLGGDPILYQHLFWFYSHPAVYIMILPALGVTNELISTFSRKPVFGYTMIAGSSIAIAVFSFIVWAHHMFTSGLSPYAAMFFSLLTFSVAIPSGIKVFSWLATLFQGSISFDSPMLFAYSFIGLFTIGGMTGLFLSTLGTDIHMHDTYFVVAHFHYVMVGGTIVGYLGALHFWWPKMFGRMYAEFPAKISAILVFVGFNLTFFPQFLLGYMGMPRRYHEYPAEFQVLNLFSTAGALVLGVGYIMPIFYLTWAAFFGKKASSNPWGATTLDWTHTESPPSPHNFESTPVVTADPYDYRVIQKEGALVAH